MKLKAVFIPGCLTVLIALAGQVDASILTGNTPTLTGGTLIDFEGQAEVDATNLYAGLGVTFYNGGSFPVIDNAPFTFAYTSNSGTGVLSLNTAPSTIGMNFSSGKNGVEFFFSDTSVLGDYTISAFGNGGGLLESFVITAATAGSSPLFLGFSRAANDIFEVRIVPVDTLDAFAIDDLRFTTGRTIPEPGTIAIWSVLGLVGLGWRRRQIA